MDSKTRNHLALAMLVLGKLFGIAGLCVGVTSYRMIAGTLLVLDGVLLIAAFVLCVQNMSSQNREEKGQKQILEQMIREGTLDQFLRDVRASRSA